MHLYEVRIKLYEAKPGDKAKFFGNVISHGHMEPSPSSLQQGLTLISHTGSEDDVYKLCAANIRKKSLITVSRITRLIWKNPDSFHSNYGEQIRILLRTGQYPDL
jgi:hypothetical protein